MQAIDALSADGKTDAQTLPLDQFSGSSACWWVFGFDPSGLAPGLVKLSARNHQLIQLSNQGIGSAWVRLNSGAR